ncbi:Putative AC9 transposase, partial [Linum grandiflorum]
KNWFRVQEEETRGECARSELEKYLAAEDDDEYDYAFDILGWWMRNKTRYPVLSAMASDILSIPVCTVSSESAFDTGGRVMDAFRSSLTPKIVEAVVCSEDWIRPDDSKVVADEEDLADQLEFEIGKCFFTCFLPCCLCTVNTMTNLLLSAWEQLKSKNAGESGNGGPSAGDVGANATAKRTPSPVVGENDVDDDDDSDYSEDDDNDDDNDGRRYCPVVMMNFG